MPPTDAGEPIGHSPMILDACLPPGCDPPGATAVERRGVLYSSARWGTHDFEQLVRVLHDGAPALAEIPSEELLTAWSSTVEAFLDPDSEMRRSLEEPLARLCGLSPTGLAAGLEAVLGGVRRIPAERLLRQVPEPAARGLLLVTLASNLPALAVQPLLPALLLRRPVILKSPTSEPLFAPAFVRALGRRLPALATSLAAVTWKGGDTTLEIPLLAAAERIVAYGEQPALDDLGRRAPGKVIGYGPKVSLAILGHEVDPTEVAAGLARDIALFDQRGCLSIHAVYTAGDAIDLAAAVAGALRLQGESWRPGPIDAAAAAGVQQIRSEAEMLGLAHHSLALDVGTVVVDPTLAFRPSPGLRTVRVHPCRELSLLPQVLAPWRERLQGIAVAGESAAALIPELEALGASHFTAPGQLQLPDALWHNGGLHPLAALG